MIKKFKTDLHCQNCINAVTPALNTADEIDDWKVDLSTDKHILTVEGEAGDDEIISLLEEKGYKAERIS